jgi:hypothetical protein
MRKRGVSCPGRICDLGATSIALRILVASICTSSLLLTWPTLAASDSDAFNIPAPADTSVLKKNVFWATQYYVLSAQNSQLPPPQAYPLLGRKRVALGAALIENNWCSAALEGTAYVKFSSELPRTFYGLLTLDRVTVAASDEKQYPLFLTVPFSFTGRISGSDYKDERGTASFKWGVRFGADWCPMVEFDGSSVNVDLQNSGFLGVKNWLARDFLSNELNKWLACGALREKFSAVWQTVTVPIAFGANTLYLTVVPSSKSGSVGFTDAIVENNRLKLKMVIDATTTLTTKPGTAAKIALPSATSHLAPPQTHGADVEGLFSGTVYPDFH